MEYFLAEPSHERGVAFTRPAIDSYLVLDTYVDNGGADRELFEAIEQQGNEEEQEMVNYRFLVGDQIEVDIMQIGMGMTKLQM
jgi:hypothetical protein